MKQNVLIVGLFGQCGGREIEVRNIVTALSQKYNVRLISMLHMTKESVAVKNLDCNATNIFRVLYNSNLILKILSVFSKRHNSSKLPNYFFVENAMSRKLFSFYEKKVAHLENEIRKTDIVLYCGVLEPPLLIDLIDYCSRTGRPIILRTIGKIITIEKPLRALLYRAASIMVHSKDNTISMRNFALKNIDVIDQTTLMEHELLKIPIFLKEKLTFGYLGRFSAEKGIVELANIFKKVSAKLIVAGSGTLFEEIKEFMSDNCFLIGEIKPENLGVFFSEIDILIIPSFEEAGPLVGIEAMAAGKIIFSTRVGAMEERLRETKNDFWFDIASENTFLEQLDRLQNITPEEIVTIRESNRKRYMENYSIKSISDQYLQVFERVKVDNK